MARRIKETCDICGLTEQRCLGHQNIIPTLGVRFKPEGIDARLKEESLQLQSGSGRTKGEQQRVRELEREMERLIAQPLRRIMR